HGPLRDVLAVARGPRAYPRWLRLLPRRAGAHAPANSVLPWIETRRTPDAGPRERSQSHAVAARLDVAVGRLGEPGSPAVAGQHEQRADQRQVLQGIYQRLAIVGRRLVPEVLEIVGRQRDVD